jgi:RpiR family carbohydrate utilization transcriptional regulator
MTSGSEAASPALAGLDGTGAATDTVLARVQAALPGLAPSEAKVARLILQRPDDCVFGTVSEVAGWAGTAASTVVRCTQQLGFRGFQDLKLALARELGALQRSAVGTISEGDSPESVLARVIGASAETLRTAASTVDPGDFAKCVEAVGRADRVLFVGLGTSAPIVADAVFRLTTIGVRVEGPQDLYAQHLVARSLAPGDVCIAVSHTGSTRETVTAMQRAGEAGATTVALTSFQRSPLTESADLVLVAGGREVAMRMEAMASRLAHAAVLDALVVAVTLRDVAWARKHLDVYAEILADHRY